MILSIIVIVTLGLIAFFHYTQGLFAATVSAFCAGVAALMAFAYHETIAATWLAEPMGAYGYPVVLCILFALIYIVLRTIIDNLLPGNVRFPVALDKVGAAVMGIMAGFFCTAILAIASQQLPVGPSFAMYSPYEVQDESVSVDRSLSRLYRVEMGDDAPAMDVMEADSLTGEEAQDTRQSLWLPVDEWFLGMVQGLSDQGSIAGVRTVDEVYPDFKQAFFAERIGVQPTVSRTLVNPSGENRVSVASAFLVSTQEQGAQFSGGIPQVDGDVRERNRSLPSRLEVDPAEAVVVLRVLFDADAREQGYVHFSSGSVRLVVGGEQYFPIGTLESAAVLVANKPDDYLFAEEGADLVFVVDRETAVETGAEGEQLADGAFLQVKRYARIDVGGMPLSPTIDPSSQTHLLRKTVVRRDIGGVVSDATSINDREAAFEQLRAAAGEGSTAPDAGPSPEGTDADPDAEGEDSPGMMGIIRQGAGERNEQIEGDN